MNKCQGCGSILQSYDEKLVGYVPLEKKDALLCARCFKIKHYNTADLLSVPVNNSEIIRIVNESNSWALFMIDFLNINEETIGLYKKITSNKILVISKVDIIPRSIKRSKLTEWLRVVYEISEDIVYLSSKKNVNTNFIEKVFKSEKQVYLLGFTNAGKSTYINKLLNHKMSERVEMTTSMIPNTTLDFVEIKLDDVTLIDSPGFTYLNTFYKNDEVDLIKRIDPKKFLSPITYQVKDITYILLEDRFLINSDISNSMTFYMSNNLELEKVYNDVKFRDLVETVYDVYDNTDLVIKGVGFINIKKACKLKVRCINKELIEIRDSLF